MTDYLVDRIVKILTDVGCNDIKTIKDGIDYLARGSFILYRDMRAALTILTSYPTYQWMKDQGIEWEMRSSKEIVFYRT